MPAVIEDIDFSAVSAGATTPNFADPKFFSSKLTGSGGKVGLLNASLLPANTSKVPAHAAIVDIERKVTHTQHDVSALSLPIATLTRRTLLRTDIRVPLAAPGDERFLVSTNGRLGQSIDVTFTLVPQGAHHYEDNTHKPAKRDFVVQYRMEVHLRHNSVAAEERSFTANLANPPFNPAVEPVVFAEWSTDPLNAAKVFISRVLSAYNAPFLNIDEIDDWMTGFSVYGAIADQAERWQTTGIADDMVAHIRELPAAPSTDVLNNLAMQLRYLENYNVSLEAYRQIHDALVAHFPDTIIRGLSKQNLNLLMNFTLDALEKLKPQLVTPPVPATPPVVPAHLSNQQKAALTTSEPLSMTQAGAGTGKSTMILARIKYLESCGVPASDITVLSFTNAAADNITAKNPDVGSMTIARMIIDIYALNHPTHKVSAIDTIINSLDIFYPNSQFAATFRHRLLEVDQNKTGAFTALNSFVEAHYEEVIQTLDRIQQTSLELQIIICYQKIDTMNEPPHVQSKYLIIDEVQDNSVFEFIYLLKYVSKHKQSMFIVGDASQTLYAFRSANPRALNTLEGSGVFATFKLTTNYRSNQPILDFANVVLGDLETNQFANIQLQANSLVPSTKDSFEKAVTLRYEEAPRLTGFVSNTLPALMQNVIIPDYVEACLARGEQVAFLAYSRSAVSAMEEALQRAYPNKHVASLVSERVYATDIFSKCIKFYWNDVLQVEPSAAAYTFTQVVRNNLDKLVKNAGNPDTEKAVLRTISQWWVENSGAINGWVELTKNRMLAIPAFFERLQDNLLSFEIRRNQEKLSLNKVKNQERKEKNLQSKSELIVSTIHGAKGLEFDNVVVLHKEDGSKASQEDKRMYYVAFTRAMKSEYVLSYGSVKNALIETQYSRLVDALDKRDKRMAALAAGLDPDELDLDDTEDTSLDAAAMPKTAVAV